jgi:hypothetical protein
MAKPATPRGSDQVNTNIIMERLLPAIRLSLGDNHPLSLGWTNERLLMVTWPKLPVRIRFEYETKRGHYKKAEESQEGGAYEYPAVPTGSRVAYQRRDY